MKIYISKKDGNSFTFVYINKQDFFTHSISVPKRLMVQDNELLRLALVSNPFDDNNIEVFGIEANQLLIDNLNNVFNIKILCDSYIKEGEFDSISAISDSEEIFLGFSGGFDSMAALAILPSSIKVSIDFGGMFEREKLFFNEFDTSVVSWDLRDKRQNFLSKFDENKQWRFMLAPLTLFRENLKNITIATGTIMEASPYWLQVGNKKELSQYSHSGYGMGVSLINPVAGLTEVTTTSIVAKKYGRDVANRSLISLAAPNTFKFHRKKTLLALANNDVYIPGVKYKFGSALTDDFLALYFCWKFGKKWVRENYSPNLPENLPDFDMSFVEKVNVENMLHMDKSFRDKVLVKTSSFGIKPFDTNDYTNLNVVNNYFFGSR